MWSWMQRVFSGLRKQRATPHLQPPKPKAKPEMPPLPSRGKILKMLRRHRDAQRRKFGLGLQHYGLGWAAWVKRLTRRRP